MANYDALASQLIAQSQKSFAEAKAANEKRYAEIIGGFDDIIGKVPGTFDAALTAGRAAIARKGVQALAQEDQSMIGRGLYNTTALDAARRRQQLGTQLENIQLAASYGEKQANLEASVRGQKLAAMSNRQDMYLDPSLYANIAYQLGQGVGQASIPQGGGGGGGGGMGGLGGMGSIGGSGGSSSTSKPTSSASASSGSGSSGYGSSSASGSGSSSPSGSTVKPLGPTAGADVAAAVSRLTGAGQPAKSLDALFPGGYVQTKDLMPSRLPPVEDDSSVAPYSGATERLPAVQDDAGVYAPQYTNIPQYSDDPDADAGDYAPQYTNIPDEYDAAPADAYPDYGSEDVSGTPERLPEVTDTGSVTPYAGVSKTDLYSRMIQAQGTAEFGPLSRAYYSK